MGFHFDEQNIEIPFRGMDNRIENMKILYKNTVSWYNSLKKTFKELPNSTI